MVDSLVQREVFFGFYFNILFFEFGQRKAGVELQGFSDMNIRLLEIVLGIVMFGQHEMHVASESVVLYLDHLHQTHRGRERLDDLSIEVLVHKTQSDVPNHDTAFVDQHHVLQLFVDSHGLLQNGQSLLTSCDHLVD